MVGGKAAYAIIVDQSGTIGKNNWRKLGGWGGLIVMCSTITRVERFSSSKPVFNDKKQIRSASHNKLFYKLVLLLKTILKHILMGVHVCL